ncbi:MAG: CDP-glycerol glycerophosphotransferase family protein [Lachnospiraceae bacterium]
MCVLYAYTTNVSFATSKVVILDGYCILASVLNHKKDLRIVQMWHAMGALKKFGYAALGNEEGKNPEISKILQMHRNYDYVICSSENCVNLL